MRNNKRVSLKAAEKPVRKCGVRKFIGNILKLLAVSCIAKSVYASCEAKKAAEQRRAAREAKSLQEWEFDRNYPDD